jgi:hypothetical protein
MTGEKRATLSKVISSSALATDLRHRAYRREGLSKKGSDEDLWWARQGSNL